MIFWFSGTGNSYWAAEELGKALDEPLVDMAAAIRAGRTNYFVHEGERVGFVFPVYYCGLPSVVAKFIEIMNISGEETPQIFTLMTCGSTSGLADGLLESALDKRALSLYSSYELKMPDNYVILLDPDNDKNQKVLASSKAKIAIIAAKIKQNWQCSIKHGPTAAIMTKMTQPLYHGGRKTKKFFADDMCVGCGKCAEVCPVEAIKIEDGKPKWVKPHCVFCMACINRCPEHAIQYGNVTKNRGRYVHPIYIEK